MAREGNSSFSSGFGAGTSLGNVRVGQERNQILRQQQQSNQQNMEFEQQQLLREKFMTNIKDTLTKVQENAKAFAPAIYVQDELGKTNREAKMAYDEATQLTREDTFEMLDTAEANGLVDPGMNQVLKRQFDIAATIHDPGAQKQIESDIQQKRDVSVSGAEKRQAATIVPENKKFVNFVKPATETTPMQRRSAREGSSEAAALAQDGFIRDVRDELVTGSPADFGMTDSQEGTVIKDLAEARVVSENFDDGLSQLQDFVRSENYVGGITGTALQLINSAAQQFSQLTNTESLFNGTELNINAIDENLSDENIGFLRRAAISGDVREAAKARLAYILAKQLDPNGRISNADVDNAERILSGSADRQSTLLTLQNLRDTTKREFDTRARIMGETVSGSADPFRPLEKNDKGGSSKKKLEDMTDQELLQQLD